MYGIKLRRDTGWMAAEANDVLFASTFICRSQVANEVVQTNDCIAWYCVDKVLKDNYIQCMRDTSITHGTHYCLNSRQMMQSLEIV